MTFRRCVGALIALQAVLLLTPSPANAGRYTVHGCRTPSGGVAPTSGWVPSFIGSWVTTENACPTGGGLRAELNAGSAHPFANEAKWRFEAAPNTRIVAFRGERASRVGAGQPYGAPGAVLGQDPGELEVCYQAFGCSGRGSFDAWSASGNTFGFDGLDSSTVYLAVLCGGGESGTCPAENPSAVASLYRSEISISDALDPQPAGAAGPAAQSGDHSGTQTVTFNVTDQGSGVYRGIVEIDGAVAQDETIDANGGKCVDANLGNGDPHEFLDRQPCKLSANVTIALDTTRVTDGDHTIRVRVLDAAGNSATVYGPAAFRVSNGLRAAASVGRGAPNGSRASDAARLNVRFARTSAPRYTAPFGRSVTVRGRLLNQLDEGIGNAAVEVLGRTSLPRAAERLVATARTADDGSFSLKVRTRGASRTLRFRYRSHLNDQLEAASARLALRVKAAVRLSIRPRSVRNRESVTFRGRLRGRPFPRSGKLVEMQVRFPSGWRTFATVRTRRSGTFRYRYRFLRTTQPTTYRFRVRVRREAGYPYATGVSRVLRVRVS